MKPSEPAGGGGGSGGGGMSSSAGLVRRPALPIRIAIRTPEKAFWESGLFASPLTVCKLRDDHTIRKVETEFAFASQEDDP